MGAKNGKEEQANQVNDPAPKEETCLLFQT
jgi:hypothetical protein